MAKKRWAVGGVVAILALPAGTCVSRAVLHDEPGSTREVLLDYSYDRFATSMIDFFPDVVTIHPGDRVRFRQAWTGEPHSVTFGRSFNDDLGRVRAHLASWPRPDADDIAELALFDRLPAMLGRAGNEFVVNQNGGQPCYLDEGLPPDDPDVACPERTQPVFTGAHSYYSSGFIAYTGERGNTFEVPFASDIEPGSYHYYCNLHGVGQSGTVVVAPKDVDIPSKAETTRAAYAAVQTHYAAPLERAVDASERGELTIGGIDLALPLAGVAEDDTRPWGGLQHRRHLDHRHGSANEFVPRDVDAVAGRPVRWTFVGRHTISFNVPRYLPVFEVEPTGRVVLDPRVHEPVGWPGRPSTDGAAHVDAGPWDGRGFRSTGLDWRTADTFSVTFTKPGTYPFACLVHPAMVGSVKVRPS